MFKLSNRFLSSWYRSPGAILPSEAATAVAPTDVLMSEYSPVAKNSAAVVPAPAGIENINTEKTNTNRDRKDSNDTKSLSLHTEESSPKTPTASSHDNAQAVNPLLYPERVSTKKFLKHLRHHRADRSIICDWLKLLTHHELTELTWTIINHPREFHNENRRRLYLDDEIRDQVLQKALDDLKRMADKAWRHYDCQQNPLNLWTKEDKDQYLLNRCLRYLPSAFIHIFRYKDGKYEQALKETEPFQAAYFPGVFENSIIAPNETLQSSEFMYAPDYYYSFDFFQPAQNGYYEPIPQPYQYYYG